MNKRLCIHKTILKKEQVKDFLLIDIKHTASYCNNFLKIAWVQNRELKTVLCISHVINKEMMGCLVGNQQVISNQQVIIFLFITVAYYKKKIGFYSPLYMKVSSTSLKELYTETIKVTETNVEEYFCRFNVRRSILNKTQTLCSMVKKVIY